MPRRIRCGKEMLREHLPGVVRAGGGGWHVSEDSLQTVQGWHLRRESGKGGKIGCEELQSVAIS